MTLCSQRKDKIFSLDFNLSSNSHWYNSITNQLHKILEILTWGLDEFGSDNCFFCTVNKKTAKLIEEALLQAGYQHKINYYRSDTTKGVECSARFGVLIGAGFVPTNSKDSTSKNKEEADRRVREDMWNETVQAMNRVKDPNGQVNSVIVSIMAESDLIDMIKHTGEWNEKIEKTKLRVPEIKPLFRANNTINFAVIKKHMGLDSKLSSDTEEPIEKICKKVPQKIQENFDSGEQQSNSIHHNSSSKRNFCFYTVIYYIYESSVEFIQFESSFDAEKSYCQKVERQFNFSEKCQLILKLFENDTKSSLKVFSDMILSTTKKA